MSIKEIIVPDIGNFAAVEVIEVAVSEGSAVNKEDTLITLETEKASMDVPSPFQGTIKEMKAKLGQKISKGDVIALMEVADDANVAKEAASKETPSKEEPQAKQEPAQSTKPAEKSIQTITVPDIGNFDSVEVIEVAIKPGDVIKKEDGLVTLETEKAAMDVPSPLAGEIKEVKIKAGDKVSKGDVIALIEVSSQEDQSKAVSTTAPAQKAESAPTQVPAQKQSASQEIINVPASVHAGPATRRLARELGVDLTKITGHGRKGRILTEDVQKYVKGIVQTAQSGGSFGIEKAPEIDFTQFGEIEVKPLSRIKKWTAKNLHRNWITIPHVTTFDEADISEMEAFRSENKQAAEEKGVKLTPLVFIVKAVLSSLKAYPQFNASLAANGSDVVYKKYYNIGIAVDTPTGLVVPVIKDANCKGLFELAAEISQMGALAREGKLKSEQMTGSCFTISSLGNLGGTAFTPIINAPDLAILGVSKAQIKPVWDDNQFVPRKMLPLSLSYDHRVIDGVEGAKFLSHLVQELQDIRKILF